MERGPEGSERKKNFLDLHLPISFYYKIRSIHEFDVDKNGGKISKIRFLKKVLKLDFPKVYFFGSSKKTLSPITENLNFAAIFCWIFRNDPENVLFVVALRRTEGPTASRSAKDRRSDLREGRRPVLSQPFVVLSYNRLFVVD